MKKTKTKIIKQNDDSCYARAQRKLMINLTGTSINTLKLKSRTSRLNDKAPAQTDRS